MKLVFFSGGLDSTAMLELLSRTDEDCIVHTCEFATLRGRDYCEAKAVEVIKDYYGDRFKWESSKLDVLNTSLGTLKDSEWFANIASMYAKAVDIDEIYFGFERDDSNADIGGVNHPLFKMVDTAVNRTLEDKHIPVVSPIDHLTKDECFDLIPDELKDKVWSCRHPLEVGGEYVACRRCDACKDYSRLGIPFLTTIPVQGESE